MTTPDTTSRPRAAIILAAGKSTRMKSTKSKVLHDLAGRRLIEWVQASAAAAGCERIICVVGEANDDVRDVAETLGMEIVVQEPQLGTGHAVNCAREIVGDYDGDVAVLFADTPLITETTLHSVFDALFNTDVAVLGFETSEPGSYGRLIETDGALHRIVEAKDATSDELAVTLCNSGVLAASSARLFSALDQVGNDNAKGEYYLTDVIEIMRRDGGNAVAVRGAEGEMLGVNSRANLASAHKAFQANMRAMALDDGVTLRDPDTVYFSYDTVIERDAVIGEHVVFGPGVTVKSGAAIQAFCHIEGATIGEGASVGPFARLRPGTELGPDSFIGNFVEVKKTKLGRGSKASHLTYLGDAEIGDGSNIGAGTVTCNYDGFFKHKTTIGDGAFIGTHTSLVAPVSVGNGAFTATGAVVTKDVPDDALAIARSDQVNKPGWAARFRDAMAKRKASR
ncbi:bifunctional protein GlmU [Algimonas ampicilliniresistens]|uniref:Bifunctional protein GlmU n=1 Tax=Algimonas ampicilliniresistens TaxID=1298735 RepID=A0ABQ5V867_9PROT|nr:bifunctional UDP-N-acetylglucosamine diphosphorylase/glucosamine-1-phosphate N-acetyltransferase GlmU [Algimonas ampicilliniresistens]GLQ23247.1 bifunctional protein GlmU [Algimonas ampicilliniresistens]